MSWRRKKGNDRVVVISFRMVRRKGSEEVAGRPNERGEKNDDKKVGFMMDERGGVRVEPAI